MSNEIDPPLLTRITISAKQEDVLTCGVQFLMRLEMSDFSTEERDEQLAAF